MKNNNKKYFNTNNNKNTNYANLNKNEEIVNNLIKQASEFLINPPQMLSCRINNNEYIKLQKVKNILKKQDIKIKTHTRPSDYSGSISVCFYVLEFSNKELKKLTAVLDDDDKISIDCDIHGKVRVDIVLPNFFNITLKD